MSLDHWTVLVCTALCVGYVPVVPASEPLALALLAAAIVLGVSLDLHIIFAEVK